MEQIFITAVKQSLPKMSKAADDAFNATIGKYFTKADSALNQLMKKSGVAPLDDAILGMTKLQGFKAGVGKGFRATSIGAKSTISAVRGAWKVEGWTKAATRPFENAMEQLAGPMMTKLGPAADEAAGLLINRAIAGTGITLGGTAAAFTVYEVITVSSSLLALYWTERGSETNKFFKDYLWSKLEIFGFDPNASEEEKNTLAKAGAGMKDKIQKDGTKKQKTIVKKFDQNADEIKKAAAESVAQAASTATYTFQKIEKTDLKSWHPIEQDGVHKKGKKSGHTKIMQLPTARGIKLESGGKIEGFIYPYVFLLEHPGKKGPGKYKRRMRLYFAKEIPSGNTPAPKRGSDEFIAVFKTSSSADEINQALTAKGMPEIPKEELDYLMYSASRSGGMRWKN